MSQLHEGLTRHGGGRDAGFTLPELLISLGLLGVVMAALTSVVVNMQRGYVNQREAERAEDALRVAETAIVTIMRTAEANPRNRTGFNAPRILVDPDGNGIFDNIRVVSDFNPVDSLVNGVAEDVLISTRNDTLRIRWQADTGTGVPVAYPVRSIRFEYFTAAGTVPLTATQIATARRVRFTLTAPRHTRTTALARRQTWVYLRNRR